MKIYELSEDGHTIEDINPSAFKHDGIIVFPSEICGHKIKNIKMSDKTRSELASLFFFFDVVIEDGVEKINEDMFRGTNIRSITIPASIETIPPHCFWGSKLEKVTFDKNSSLKTIGPLAFAKCKHLESIFIPSTVKTIDERAFLDCELTEINLSLLKDGIDIGENAFAENKHLKKVILPKAKVNLQKYAFSACETLETVEMDKTDILTIPKGAFLNCFHLKNIILPNTVSAIEEGAFYHCNALKTVGLDNTSVVRIGDNAFDECHSYSDGKFPNTLIRIGTKAFNRCNLNGLSLPLFTLKEIGDEVFEHNPIKGVVDLRPLLSCEKIGHSIFAYTDVKSVQILPFSSKEVSCKYMFDGCKSLKAVNLASDSILYEGMFNGCSSLEEVTLSDTIESIPPYTFRNASNLRSIKFPSSLKSIEYSAFYMSGFKAFDLSDTNSLYIDTGAFMHTSLETIKLPSYGCTVCKKSFEPEKMEAIKRDYPFVNIVD